MTYRRIIRPCPAISEEPVPEQAVIVYGTFDYIDDGSTPQPADALYVATLADGKIEVTLDTFDPVDYLPNGEPKPNTHPHTFSGWPTPGEVIPP